MASKDDFNMRQSTEMWDAFLRLAKWVIIVCVVTLAFMAMFLT
ncbi:MAG TPA: aa3-type cytochrome c oxidase subunit IV [Alphaproteobacteria bacterium]|nr:aa3-type cytochrome c oxidase subunit IV [Alphaproteobacteria bacterium]